MLSADMKSISIIIACVFNIISLQDGNEVWQIFLLYWLLSIVNIYCYGSRYLELLQSLAQKLHIITAHCYLMLICIVLADICKDFL